MEYKLISPPQHKEPMEDIRQVKSGNIFYSPTLDKDVILTFTITHYAAGKLTPDNFNLSEAQITEDRLKNLGFNLKNKTFNTWEIKVGEKYFGYNLRHKTAWYGAAFEKNIQFVNHLQNLVFNWTNRELKINNSAQHKAQE